MQKLNRASNIIKGSFLADAATMPLHWIYNQKDLSDKVGGDRPAFFGPPSCPFYKYPTGVFSPYGDESIPLLRSISSVGEFVSHHTADRMYTFFKSYPDASVTGYEGRLNHAPKLFVEARDKEKGWSECAQDDFQANGLAKVPLIVARYAGSENLLNEVEAMVRILQNNSLSVSNSQLYARVLEGVLLTDQHPSAAINSLLLNETLNLSSYDRNLLQFITSDEKIAEWVHFSDDLEAVQLLEGESPFLRMRIKGSVLPSFLAAQSQPIKATIESTTVSPEEGAILSRLVHTERAGDAQSLTVSRVLSAIGLSCALPGALLGTLYVARVSPSFAAAVEANILAGGDNSSRGMAIGALFGAWSGSSAQDQQESGEVWPADWTQKVNAALWSEVCEAADKIAADNKTL